MPVLGSRPLLLPALSSKPRRWNHVFWPWAAALRESQGQRSWGLVLQTLLRHEALLVVLLRREALLAPMR